MPMMSRPDTFLPVARRKITADKDTYLFIKLDVDDFYNGSGDDDELLEEVYFKWSNVRGSNFDIRFGKGELAYGQDKDVVRSWYNGQ